MLPWLDAEMHVGNPASDHALGPRARAAVERARGEVATLLGAKADETIWTSGATEPNHLALHGAMEFRDSQHALARNQRLPHMALLSPCPNIEPLGVWWRHRPWRVTGANGES